MTTATAETLIARTHRAFLADHSIQRARHVAAPEADAGADRPLRYEDFQARTSDLGEVLGGHLFPRRF